MEKRDESLDGETRDAKELGPYRTARRPRRPAGRDVSFDLGGCLLLSMAILVVVAPLLHLASLDGASCDCAATVGAFVLGAALAMIVEDLVRAFRRRESNARSDEDGGSA